MSDEKRRILEMLSQGKITVEGAEKLLGTIREIPTEASAETSVTSTPKFLRIQVDSQENGETDRVNIKVPFQLLRSGVKLAALMPNGIQDKVNESLKEKGFHFDLSKIKESNLEELIQHLSAVSIDVDRKDDKVRIFCE